MDAYLCDRCGMWHATTPEGRKPRDPAEVLAVLVELDRRRLGGEAA